MEICQTNATKGVKVYFFPDFIKFETKGSLIQACETGGVVRKLCDMMETGVTN